ncbi:hypothetical protein ACTFIR_012509 [Dictyostelium discoideum]
MRIFILLLLILSLLVNFSFCLPLGKIDEIFKNWMVKYNKHYKNNKEYLKRFDIFQDNYNFILNHRNKNDENIEMDLNEYSDLTHKEFADKFFEKLVPEPRSGPINDIKATPFKHNVNATIPKSFDWRDHGAVGKVKNQGSCSSCWSFSALGALEGHYYIKYGELLDLSEQNLVDCATPFGPKGCKTGWMHDAFKYIISSGGVNLESQYPYTGKDEVCKFNQSEKEAKVSGYVMIPKFDESALMEAIALYGPVAVPIDTSTKEFQHLSGGIYYSDSCDPWNTIHAVLAIGYGTDENGVDYFLMKNSWGKSWGTNGFFKVKRGVKGKCGIVTAASYPIVA